MKHFFGSLFSAVTWVIIVLLLLMVLSGIYQNIQKKDAYTGFFGIGYAVVVSGSMEPAIHVDDMIIYQSVSREEFELGNVIVYRRPQEDGTEILITHRVIRIHEDGLITKGDANPTADPEVPWDRVVGKVLFRVPAVGAVSAFVRTPKGLVTVSAAAVLLFFLNTILRRAGKKKRKVKTVMGEQYIRY